MLTDVQKVLVMVGAFALLGDFRSDMRDIINEPDELERFIDCTLSNDDDVTAQQILQAVREAVPEFVKISENA